MSNSAAVNVIQLNNIEQMVYRARAIKDQIAKLEAEYAKLRGPIEMALKQAPDQILDCGDIEVFYQNSERKSWDYDAAVEAVGKREVNKFCKIYDSASLFIKYKKGA